MEIFDVWSMHLLKEVCIFNYISTTANLLQMYMWSCQTLSVSKFESKVPFKSCRTWFCISYKITLVITSTISVWMVNKELIQVWVWYTTECLAIIFQQYCQAPKAKFLRWTAENFRNSQCFIRNWPFASVDTLQFVQLTPSLILQKGEEHCLRNYVILKAVGKNTLVQRKVIVQQDVCTLNIQSSDFFTLSSQYLFSTTSWICWISLSWPSCRKCFKKYSYLWMCPSDLFHSDLRTDKSTVNPLIQILQNLRLGFLGFYCVFKALLDLI